MQVTHRGLGAPQPRSRLTIEFDQKPVGRHVPPDDDVVLEIRVRRHANSATLPEREEMEALVAANDFTGGGSDDVAGSVGHMVAKEVAHANIADKTDALTVLFAGIRQTGLGRRGSDLGLQHPADGESGGGQLVLREHGEKVALVLVGIRSLKKFPPTVRGRPANGIVAGCHG